jgi:hypothetical protein
MYRCVERARGCTERERGRSVKRGREVRYREDKMYGEGGREGRRVWAEREKQCGTRTTRIMAGADTRETLCWTEPRGRALAQTCASKRQRVHARARTHIHIRAHARLTVTGRPHHLPPPLQICSGAGPPLTQAGRWYDNRYFIIIIIIMINDDNDNDYNK